MNPETSTAFLSHIVRGQAPNYLETGTLARSQPCDPQPFSLR